MRQIKDEEVRRKMKQDEQENKDIDHEEIRQDEQTEEPENKDTDHEEIRQKIKQDEQTEEPENKDTVHHNIDVDNDNTQGNKQREAAETEEDKEKIDLTAEVLLAMDAIGLERKEHERKVKAAINNTPCLINDYSERRYCRITMSDTNGPPGDTTDIYKRHCSFADYLARSH